MKGQRMGTVIILTLFLVSVNTFQVKAEYVVGVRSGDWVKHDVSLSGNVNPITHEYWTKITVYNVSGTVISGIFEEKSSSGLSPPQNFSIDIMQAHSSYVLKDYYFVPANLTVGSVIPALNLTILGMSINRFGREEVYTWVTGGGVSGWGGYWNISYSWDRSTGVLMGFDPGGTSIEFADTNLWFVGIDWMFWTLVIMAIVVVVMISLGLFIRRRRHLKRLAESYVYSPPPTTPDSST